MDPETQVLIKERVPPLRFLEHNFGSCASFNIRKLNLFLYHYILIFQHCSAYADNMRFFQIQSPNRVTIYIHDKNQNKIHIELAKVIKFEGNMKCRHLRLSAITVFTLDFCALFNLSNQNKTSKAIDAFY